MVVENDVFPPRFNEVNTFQSLRIFCDTQPSHDEKWDKNVLCFSDLVNNTYCKNKKRNGLNADMEI